MAADSSGVDEGFSVADVSNPFEKGWGLRVFSVSAAFDHESTFHGDLRWVSLRVEPVFLGQLPCSSFHLLLGLLIPQMLVSLELHLRG